MTSMKYNMGTVLYGRCMYFKNTYEFRITGKKKKSNNTVSHRPLSIMKMYFFSLSQQVTVK